MYYEKIAKSLFIQKLLLGFQAQELMKNNNTFHFFFSKSEVPHKSQMFLTYTLQIPNFKR